MKQTLTTITALLMCYFSISQAVPNDGKTKVEQLSKTSVRVTNLQNCATAYKLLLPNRKTYDTTTSEVTSGNSIVINFRKCGEFRATPLTFCSGTCGIVGLYTCTVLAVKGTAKFLQNGNDLTVELHLTEPTNDKTTNVQVNFSDGTSKMYAVPLDNKVGVNTYSYTLKID